MEIEGEIKAAIESLEDILVSNKKFYQIPDYQRPYSWDKDNLSDLINDLLSSYLENKKETYFCGSSVLVKNKSDARFDIIDGQQRITSFIIISCVFRDADWSELVDKAQDFINPSIQDKYEDNKRKLRFLTNEQYQINFETTVLQGINFEPTILSEKEFLKRGCIYLQNAYYIRDFLVEGFSDNEIDINDFVIWFFEKVVLAVVTCPSQDSAIQIFNVLNGRGMPLTSADILQI